MKILDKMKEFLNIGGDERKFKEFWEKEIMPDCCSWDDKYKKYHFNIAFELHNAQKDIEDLRARITTLEKGKTP